MVIIKSPAEISSMRASGRLLATILNELESHVDIGISLKQLDDIARKLFKKYQAQPVFLGYEGFPATICTSVNDRIVHGIPDDYQLQDGDLLSIDIGAELDGWLSDTATTVAIGDVSPELLDLMDATQLALAHGIRASVPGNTLGDIGSAVASVANQYNYGIVREMCGHGIGRELHEDPCVMNYGEPGKGLTLRAGMVIAIEPMFNLGSADIITDHQNWIVRTKDGLPSAHFEHTIAITDSSPQILTVL